MESANKSRTPSRCREWERQRRNKFNEAISKLEEIVKAILKSNDTSGKDIENVQYPKIEVIQKAIMCLSNCIQEKTQMKAEILALQVKLDGEKNMKSNNKDASTQVYKGFNKKNKSKKFVKILMLQKSKRNTLKEKSVATNVTKPLEKEPLQNVPTRKMPKLLPRNTVVDKKGLENTIVVLPASPYIFPQRPFLLPAVPPAILLVDPNLPSLNKPNVPILNRNSGDITKTTMVNILPISAYSYPLSAGKSKKNNVKLKRDIMKKAVKKSVPVVKSNKQSTYINDPSSSKKLKLDEIKENDNTKTENNMINKNVKETVATVSCNIKNISNKIAELNVLSRPDHNKQSVSYDIKNSKITNENNSSSCDKISTHITEQICTDTTKSIQPVETEKPISITIPPIPTPTPKIPESIKITVENKANKTTDEKETLPVDKGKENKLPNILDTTLCDNVVDVGNARLELAEEFLAASPTAAFLMSFPLVSGNRADSPAEDPPTVAVNSFEKVSNAHVKTKPLNKVPAPPTVNNKEKINDNVNNKQMETKTSATVASNENPFLNLPTPSLITTNCTLSDTTFGLDFECNISKPSMTTQPTCYASNNNLFYKSDPFSTVKSTIYSTSSITSGHEFNGLGLYPCAMEKYTSKSKSDFSNVEDNLMKIGSSRLTYDIDLGWSHKSFDFVNCTTTSNTFNKDSILTTASAPYSTTYNPFNPEFHVPLVSSAGKKDNVTNKPSSFAETITSLYSQPTNLWTEDVPFYSNNTAPKPLSTKHQNYTPLEHGQANTHIKPNTAKHYETKQITETVADNLKHTNVGSIQQMGEKYTKKSSSKMHINWMTSEIRPMQNNCNTVNGGVKEAHKPIYTQVDQANKKQDHNESNYFPISMHSFPTVQEEFQVWPSARPLGTTEISIDPPPINLPTLVGDLALGPHDRKKNLQDVANRAIPQTDVQNCGNFLSVTQLMNRSTDNMSSRYHGPNIEQPKSIQAKHNHIMHYSNDNTRKSMTSRLDSHIPQPCYVFNDPKSVNSYDNMPQFSQNKNKVNNKSDKGSKSQKNNYSAEALIRGGSCTQKIQENGNSKFVMPSQKFNDFNAVHDSSVAQVSHFPPILDYSDNSYAGQQFSGTTLYNATTNTISNSFYTNLMPGSTNLMSSNYTSGPFTGDYIDYNQNAECSYTNHRYEELKMKNNAIFQHDKAPANYKGSRRESTVKHKLDCSKKETSKKYQSKRAKVVNEVEEWNDPSHLLWQNKASNKKQPHIMSEELPFPNYVGNQMPTQYQPDYFNSHLMATNMQSVGHNVDRSLSTYSGTSRTNFNLSTIFPEITMKVQ